MELYTLLSGIPYETLAGRASDDVTSICCDSRKASPGAVFVCLTGAEADGHDYIGAAYEKGARAFLVEGREYPALPGAAVIRVPDTRIALALISARFFQNPSEKMKMIGITGTKGKTSTSFMLASVLEEAGIKTGVIGTTGIFFGDKTWSTANTTPESYELQSILAQMAGGGARAAVMEVSSQGLKQHRTDGIVFDCGVFLNLSADHLGKNEHASFAEYAHCKSLLFSRCRRAFACADSPFAPEILSKYDGITVTFGVEGGDWRASEITPGRDDGRLTVSFDCAGPGGYSGRLTVGMPGIFSVYNALAAAAVAHSLGASPEHIERGLRAASVPGRTEPVPVPAPFSVLIDYAHNAVSMESLMRSVSMYGPRRIISVFGCGGSRAKARRADMGAVAGKYCALTVLTSDNPRDEEVGDIIADIVKGIEPTGGPYEIVPDRAEAIARAVSAAGEGDIVLVIGKGHQRYEEVRGVRRHFDDREAVRRCFSD